MLALNMRKMANNLALLCYSNNICYCCNNFALLRYSNNIRYCCNNFSLLRYSNNIRTYCLLFLFICNTCVSLHLLLSTSFCLYDSLERKIGHQLRPWILCVKNKLFRKFSPQNIFVREHNDDNFLRELFGIENNANKNEANYCILKIMLA